MLVEVLVASACAGLVGAAALGLLQNGAIAAGLARDRIHGLIEAGACSTAFTRALTFGLRGLEGATSIEMSGLVVPRVAGSHTALAVWGSSEAPVEVLDDGSGWYIGPVSAPLAPGATVVALPVSPSGVAVSGQVLAVSGRPGAIASRVVWNGTPVEPVRALASVERIEVDLADGALRRRRGLGNWQPVVDGIVSVNVAIGYDRDADSRVDPPLLPLSAEVPLGGAVPVLAGVACSTAGSTSSRTWTTAW